MFDLGIKLNRLGGGLGGELGGWFGGVLGREKPPTCTAVAAIQSTNATSAKSNVVIVPPFDLLRDTVIAMTNRYAPNYRYTYTYSSII